MERLCSAALEFQATMYSLPIRAEYNIHVETLALFSKISTSVARQVAPRHHVMLCCCSRLQSCFAQSPAVSSLSALCCKAALAHNIGVADPGMCPLVQPRI